jgi:glycosyltransferase involved in cell wall biosynthesis
VKKKVLIFTYYFPPAGGVAVQRFLKFSKFLPEFGWEPIIVTVKNGSYPYYDESLLSEVSPQLKVFRTNTFEPFELYNLLRGQKGKSLPVVSVGNARKSFFQKFSEYIRANYFIPDARKGWIPFALKCARGILKTEQIDAVITTGPPHSTHLIGLKLKQQYGVKWIADFRDPWTGIFYNDILPRTQATKLRDKALEDEVLKQADAVTVISPGLQHEFAARVHNLKIIYNGYDEADFNQPASNAANKVFTLAYVGNLLASQNVDALWQAIARLHKEGFNLKFELTGRADAPVIDSMENAGIKSLITVNGFVPHHKAVNRMMTADMLLFVVPDVSGNELILTGKLFEYLGARTPLLSIGPATGNAAKILKDTGRDAIIDYANEEAIYRQLLKAVESFNRGEVSKFPPKYGHEVFTRKNQTAEMAQLLNAITDNAVQHSAAK